jgi:DNA (cytosine-5)-methyltransferase 1
MNKISAKMVPVIHETVGALCADSHPGAYSGQDAYTGRLIPQPIAYSFDSLASNSMKSSNPHSGCNSVDVSKALDTSRGLDPSCNQGGIGIAHPAYAIQGSMIGRNDNAGPQGDGVNVELCFTQNTIDRHAVAQPIGVDVFNAAFSGEVAVPLTNRSDGTGTGPTVMQPIAFEPGKMKRLGYGDSEPGLAHALRAEAGDNQLAIATPMAVRRLTPTECERLQGFPDGYTNIPWRKAVESPDGPRYKALGNSWAVPVVRWIGERIARAT